MTAILFEGDAEMDNAILFEKMLKAMIGEEDAPVVVVEYDHSIACECPSCQEWLWLIFGDDVPSQLLEKRGK